MLGVNGLEIGREPRSRCAIWATAVSDLSVAVDCATFLFMHGWFLFQIKPENLQPVARQRKPQQNYYKSHHLERRLL